MPQGFLCVAGHQVVAPKSPPVVCWPAIGPWQSAIGVVANHKLQQTVFALAVMEYAVDVSKFGKNPMTLLVHQY